MRKLILSSLLLPAIAAAEPAPLASLDFAGIAAGGKFPAGLGDNTFEGPKPALKLVDSGDAKRGTELEVAIAAGGFAQIILVHQPLEKGVSYRATARISAKPAAKVDLYFRLLPKPYTRYMGVSQEVDAAGKVLAAEGPAPDTQENCVLMLYCKAPEAVLRVDDIRIERVPAKP